MENNKMSILVFSCDAYSDLWDDFFRFMDIYWPSRSYDCYLVNNKKDYKRDGVKVINAGDGDWSSRARFALEEIKSSYVMTFLEDYFLCKTINNEKIAETITYIQNEGIDYYQLDMDGKEDYRKWSNYNNHNYLFNIPKNRDYGIDLSVSIWNKAFFLELIGNEDYSAWKFELNRCDDARNPERYGNRIFVLDAQYSYIMCPMVIQGKYYPKSISYMQKKGHKIDISNRLIMSHKDVLRYKIKRIMSHIPFARKFFKSIGRKFGYKFMSDLNNVN